MERFAIIFWHYHGGALFGVRQRLWPNKSHASMIAMISAILLYSMEWGALLLHLPREAKLGLLLIVLSPQWLYVLPIDHPVFEFRGYSMAMGVALILSSLLRSTPIMWLVLVVFWAAATLRRRKCVVEPFAFWRRAQEENNGSKL